jgi:membrane-associated protease RseP (regulator of RpoE activity)
VLLLGVHALTGGITGMTVQLLQYGVGQGIGGGDLLARALLMLGLMHVYVGALSLVPLPPLDGGRLLFALAPRSPGLAEGRAPARRARASASPSCSRCCSSRSAGRRRCCRCCSTRSSDRSPTW